MSSLASKVSGLARGNLLSIGHLSAEELSGLIGVARAIKTSPERYHEVMKGDTVAMIFHKRSTRTRVSTEMGVSKLGGSSVFLTSSDMHKTETVRDSSTVLSRFSSLILARVDEHKAVTDIADHATVPVINALSDAHHPLQTLADLMTLSEHFGEDSLTGRTVAWVGDGNNVLHDLMLGCVKMGMNVNVATPQGYEPDSDIVAMSRDIHPHVTLTNDPHKAVSGSDVVVTDTWVSMGQDAEKERRMESFKSYQVDAKMMGRAKDDAVFLHCLPRYPLEVTDDVFYSPKSLVFDEAENRMWTVMSTMVSLLGKVKA